MNFKSDKQRRAAFANMNSFSVASTIVDLFPGGNGFPDIVGLSSEGVEREMEQWRQAYAGSRFSDQASLKVDGKEYKEKPIRLTTDTELDKIASDGLEDAAMAADAERNFNEYRGDDDQSFVTEQISVEEPTTVYETGSGLHYDEVSGLDMSGSVYESAPQYEGVSYDQTVTTEGIAEPVGGYEQRFKEEVVDPAREASVGARAVIGHEKAVEDISREDIRSFYDRAGRAFISGDSTIQQAHIVGYDKLGNPIVRTKAVEEGGLRGAALRDIAAFGAGIGSAPTKVGSGVKSIGSAVGRGIEKAAAPALARGALAFGEVAGGAVAGGLREFGDIIEGPQRLYTQERAGLTQVWDPARQGYRLEKARDRVPMQPFVPQMGVGQVPGVRASPDDLIAGQAMLQGGLFGMSGGEAEKLFLERAKKGGQTFRTSSYVPMRGISRTASSALRQKSELDRMRSALGQSNPNVQRQQAALQSKVGYLDRRTSPGSKQDLIIRASGLKAV